MTDIETVSTTAITHYSEPVDGLLATPGSGIPPVGEKKNINVSDCGDRCALIYSVPRLMFSDGSFAATKVCGDLGMRCVVHTSAYWSQSLMRMSKMMLDDPKHFDYIITADYDSLYSTKDVLYLYALMQLDPTIDCIAAMQMKRGCAEVLMNQRDETGKLRNWIEASKMNGEVVRVSLAHFGLTIFRADKLRALTGPWFLRLPDDKIDLGSVDDDIYFWRKWEDVGNNLYVAPSVGIGHLELTATWVGKDYAPVRQSVEEYQRKGKPEGVR